MSTLSKRRLSKGGNNLLGVIVDEEEQQVLRGSGRKSIGGRKSFGGKDSTNKKNSHEDAAKQLRLAQMYSRIIQMSTENVV